MGTKTQTKQNEQEAPVTETKALTPYQRVEGALQAKRQQIIDMYGGDERMADRMRMVALHALADPKLAWKLERADFATVVEAIRESASLGLMPIGSTAEGYLIPRKNTAKSKAQRAAGRAEDVYDFTFLPGWRGLLKLTLRSGKVTSVDAEVVYENDVFEYEKGSNPWLRHVRKLGDRGNVAATYAIAYLKEGPPIFEIMDEAEMEMIRRSSTSRDYDTGALIGPWMEWPDEMRRKSALRRLDKRLPLDHIAERALEYEAEIDERYSLPDPSRGQRPAQITAGTTAAQRARAAFTDEPAQEPENGSGRPEGEPMAADTAQADDEAQRPSTDCGAQPPAELAEGGPCVETAGEGHRPYHSNAVGTWPVDKSVDGGDKSQSVGTDE